MWSICPVTLKHGDCAELLKTIPDGTVDLIVADPPYFLGMTHNGQKGDFNDLAICKPFFISIANEFKRILSQKGEFYIFTDWRGYAFYYPVFAEILPLKNLIVWDKKSGAGNFYTYSHEFIMYGVNCNKNKGGRNVWVETAFSSGAQKTNGKKVHPTQKPVELIERIINNSSEDGDTILDPFMGSGTTGVAAERIGNRNFIGFELNDRYFEIAKQRINDAAFLMEKRQ